MSLFFIACGGTGGHLSPGISLAESLQVQGHECILIVSRKSIDGRLLEKYPHLRFRRAPGPGLAWNPVGLARFVVSQTQALFFAAKLLVQRRPAAFVSFGGFLTLGMAVVCKLAGVPVILHEANRIPGKAVRLLGRIANRVWLPPGVVIRGLSPVQIRHAAFPVRKEIQRLPKAEARQALGMPVDGKLLLVLGGSQGAAPLNKWVKESFEKLASSGINVLCVTGPDKAGFEPIYLNDAGGVSRCAVFIPFCAQMSEALSAADLIVSRAGAGSIAEITACELPAILVPFPFAADRHQDENARFFEQQGGGVVIKQSQLGQLADEVTNVLNDEWLLERFCENLRRMRSEFDWHAMVVDLLDMTGGAVDSSRQEVRI
ncbi:MAG: UDP-N-acetylglucosamine--N-acetylmuramyl-(pentapeptide) pyrophosphoryl-undecaprenol N-acetylglucosamine transferase [Puniceicoccales bacterium]|jgi:UDP-N-acetylglucosamine--N-acetylmuramyl-(pentapeptide) pyrophosphoryl-undecaprenol N-acetylglucosamine transferase|nr:UDP-N-acetylglucosamine--N-acetylmuramyl-(pentapeptide) pyrophosphoryl-undecaprenol N-acetylglucosamine transferase [Puniceicoccales bacterium]